MLTLTSQIGSGSYQTDDIQFLLRPLNISPTDVAQKEHLIQSGQKHYSEMISTEHAPSANHQAIFEQALAQGGARMAQAVPPRRAGGFVGASWRRSG